MARTAEPSERARVGVCPLCGSSATRAGAMQQIRFEHDLFGVRRCSACRSRFLDPMPDATCLTKLYGPDYAGRFEDPYVVEDPKALTWVVDVLRRRPGSLVDFGCGQGRLLGAILSVCPERAGVELDARVAATVSERTGVRVWTLGEVEEGSLPQFDYVHLGDVIEHLTTPFETVSLALTMLRPGGLLLAQGPLEGNRSLFTSALWLSQWVKRGSIRDDLPTHVLLATARGQARLFERLGLAAVELDIYEVDWPAPSRLRRSDLRHPRTVLLYAARRASKALSRPLDGWGNRYVYAGVRQKAD